MKARKAVALAAGLVIALAACKEEKPNTIGTIIDNNRVNVADTTIYGKCTENLGMNSMEIVTDTKDTLQFIIVSDPDSVRTETVKGGKCVGDRMAVVGYKNQDGEWVITSAINLTTLLGKWTALDKNFEIQEGGIVVSNFQEPKPYTEWKISNGRLVLSSDTFDIYELGADSLLLENDKGIYAYKRLK